MFETLPILPTPGPLVEATADALVVPIPQEGPLEGSAALVDAALDGLLEEMRRRGEFRGEARQATVLPTLGRLPAPRVALAGLGKAADRTLHTYRLAMAAAFRALGRRGLTVAAADPADAPFPLEAAAAALAEAAEFSRYVPDPYRTGERREARLAELRVVGAEREALRAALREGAVVGRAKNLARELVNEPGNRLDPPELARRAAALASEVGLECEVFGLAEIERLGMGAILAVARGSETPPTLTLLRHIPRSDGPILALVGKGVTFDTGGISIKPAQDMARMKGDMAGGAAVVAAMAAIAALRVPLRVVGLVPAVVNMPDGRAWKPGDVVTAMSGTTIETITTDAEGRMLLADAIHYARTSLGATHVVDIATLTGACVIALGHVASALYATDEALAEALLACGEAAGERHWRMPLFPEYREQIRSEIADLKNSGGRPAGSITAAWFVREFAGDTPWAHLDIAGTAHWEKSRPWAPAGPTGTGVGTLVRLAQRMAVESA